MLSVVKYGYLYLTSVAFVCFLFNVIYSLEHAHSASTVLHKVCVQHNRNEWIVPIVGTFLVQLFSSLFQNILLLHQSDL